MLLLALSKASLSLRVNFIKHRLGLYDCVTKCTPEFVFTRFVLYSLL